MLSTISYRIITGIVAVCNWLRLVRWQVSGIENLPARNSGMILVCNHLEWHDIPLIGWGLPVAYQPWWFAKHDLRDGWWYGWWVKRMPIIPVRRGATRPRRRASCDSSSKKRRSAGGVPRRHVGL